MSELGQQLREARLQKGMSLDDVQEMTKIRKRYLEAIEAGDYKVLPGSFYVRAFIKTYAEAVGIDPEELLEGHKQDVPKNEPEATMEPVIQKRASRPAAERNMKWLPTLLMWTFPILIVGVIYWVAVMNNNSDDEPPVGNNDQTQTDNNQAQTPQDPPEVPGDGEGEDGQGGGDGSNDGAGDDETDETGTDEPDETTSGEITVTQDRTEGRRTVFKVTGTEVKVQIVAGSDAQSWVEVYRGSSASGEKLFFDMLQNGAEVSYDLDGQGLFIKSGNSAATTITVGDQTVTDGKSTSNIVLEPATAGE
ncbi:helix-turn-helix domain-containing protein [Paenibacillus sp. JCM 10914]|uniref:helix-turn-helix domain-containing protein n=1 Tax=Paenibacillus sp. JCM 10914 TaxID=1236974 RepID=UPI0003CCB317|nr:helix-turn-helix domain-containing protein [Paenibacillus sp. JCM 10914]GAE04855.1 transcriptional regulator in cluster with unspecified monosaccharide ABC transport system [Paenibacillus sp. JCM 10914]